VKVAFWGNCVKAPIYAKFRSIRAFLRNVESGSESPLRSPVLFVGRIGQNKLIFLQKTLNALRPRKPVSRFCIQGCSENNLGQNRIMGQLDGDCWRWPIDQPQVVWMCYNVVVS